MERAVGRTQKGWLRRWAPVLGGIAGVLLLSLLMLNLRGGLLGITGWVIVGFAVGAWDAVITFRWWRALVQTWRSGAFRWTWILVGLAFLGITAAALALVPLGLLGPKLPYFLAFMAAFGASLWAFTQRKPHRRRDYFIPAYNLFGGLVTLVWVLYESGEPPGLGPGTVLTVLARGNALFQTTTFYLLAVFVPLFLLPPVILEPPPPAPLAPSSAQPILRLPAKASTALRWTRKGISAALGGFVIYAVVLQLIFALMAADGVTSLTRLPAPEDQTYRFSPSTQFAVVGGSLTDIVRPPADWETTVDQEIDWALELGVDYLRFDIKTEFLHSVEGAAVLNATVAAARASGLEVILAPFGSDRWASDHPSFEELRAVLDNDAELLARWYHPAWLFPYFEPNGQAQINLGAAMPTETWVGAIRTAAEGVKRASPETRILVEVADGPQGHELFAALLDPSLPIDGVGFDLYPSSAEDLQKVDWYAEAAEALNPFREFWISEFGLEALQFGEQAQARYIAAVLARGSTEWNVSGFCVWGLEDGTGMGLQDYPVSRLGIVTPAGRLKPAFEAYSAAIAAIRGS